MKRRAYLRTVSLAVPGFLLTGWAPARPSVRAIHLVIHDGADGADAESLRAGVDMGLDEVAQNARLLDVPLFVQRAGEDTRVVPCSDHAVHLVAVTEDDRHPADGATPCGPRIYTSPLREWRPDAWSVASPLPSLRRPQEIRLDWHPTLDTPAAAQLNGRFLRRTGRPMDAAAWRGWMAAKVAFEVALRFEAGEDDLLALQFDGHKGQPLRFSEDGHLVQPTCRMVGGRAALAAPVDHDLLMDAD
ncbi:ABC transporter, substrate binding protein, PQQ-dependent alcohol dehydrogenase system [Luteitalea pratensis]|uniref:ABC transporter, substrate binding protein, PQQ-dependent alcohol dehydrogenase system n=2 Tax=Luteitalea pratensis TaxID=1855912 RepID=A0A143PF40_LUTPR|nr:ABC transporter, substrate binding protein, PQQ-dependent alcohol dehydrogenase system [Luteitalea pratensis]